MALPMVFALTLHEAAQGYAARYFGDNTGWMMGRLTLNPAKHIDPIGTLFVPALLYLATSGAAVIGYAKPMPIRFDLLRNPRRNAVLVLLAGPLSNFLQAFVWGVLFLLLHAANVSETFFLMVCGAGMTLNLLLFAFLLFPLPPLSGGRILVMLLPPGPAQWLARLEPWGFFIVMGLALTGILSTLWLVPIKAVASAALNLLLYPLILLTQ